MDKLITEILRLSFFRYILTIPLGLISLILLAVNIQIALTFIMYITTSSKENIFSYANFINIFMTPVSFVGENIIIMLALSIIFGELIALIGELKLFGIFRFIDNSKYDKSLKESSLYRIKSSLYPNLQNNGEFIRLQNNGEFISLVDLVKVVGIRNLAEQSELNYSLARFFSGLSFIIKLNIFMFSIPLLMFIYLLLDKYYIFNNELFRTTVFVLISNFTILFFTFIIQKLLSYKENGYYTLIKDVFTAKDGVTEIYKRIRFLSTTMLVYLTLIIILWFSLSLEQNKPDILMVSLLLLSFIIFYSALYLIISILAAILKSFANQINFLIVLEKENKNKKNIIT